jgi:hypothetical protein
MRAVARPRTVNGTTTRTTPGGNVTPYIGADSAISSAIVSGQAFTIRKPIGSVIPPHTNTMPHAVLLKSA